LGRERVRIIAIFVTIFLVLCGYYWLTQGRKNISHAKLIKQAKQERVLNDTQNQIDNNSNSTSKQNSNLLKPEDYYTVHIAGEVVHPGVYGLDKKSRVIDAIEKAGGATENADLDRINLAEYIKDAEKIRIPNINERGSNSNNSTSSLFSSGYGGGTNTNAIESINYKAATPNNNYSLIGANSITDDTDNTNTESKPSGDLININTADINKLQELPGVGAATATNIISYREENGDFQSIEDLKSVPRIGDKTFDKLKDRITVE